MKKTDAHFKVVITDGATEVGPELGVLSEANCELVVANCKNEEDVIAVGRDADALLVGDAPISAKVIAALEKCKIIVRAGAGYDAVDVEAAAKKKIAVCNVPGATTDEVADHTLALALSLARRIPQADQKVRQGAWSLTSKGDSTFDFPAFREMFFVVLGFGKIGKAVLQRARAFGFCLGAFDSHSRSNEFKTSHVREMTLDEALSQADILSLNLPLTPETRHILNARRLLQMKPGAIIVNTGRGELIDTAALIEALRSGHIACAGLDVFEEEPLPKKHPLYELPNVLLTPHLGAYSRGSGARVMKLAAEEILRGLRGEKLHNPVE
jgi:D-3-phosphoglycerate dehydrogenase